MKVPNPRQREAIQALQKHYEQWEQLLIWLQGIVQQVQQDCSRADNEIDIRRLQGQAHLANRVLEMLTPKPD